MYTYMVLHHNQIQINNPNNKRRLICRNCVTKIPFNMNSYGTISYPSFILTYAISCWKNITYCKSFSQWIRREKF